MLKVSLVVENTPCWSGALGHEEAELERSGLGHGHGQLGPPEWARQNKHGGWSLESLLCRVLSGRVDLAWAEQLLTGSKSMTKWGTGKLAICGWRRKRSRNKTDLLFFLV